MLIAAAALVALIVPAVPPVATPPAQQSDTTAPEAAAVEAAARAWLRLGDEGAWDAALAGTAATFRTANTPQRWRDASERVRVPLGRVDSRTLVTQQAVPTPPNGGWVVRFRTDFAAKRGAIETVSLIREDGAWKVTGVYLE